MKKTFLLITVLSVIAVFCSCSKAAHITPVTRGISFTAELTYYNESYIALVTVSKNGDTDIAFTAPGTLNGLMLHFGESGVTAKYNGLEYKYDISSVPDGPPRTMQTILLCRDLIRQVVTGTGSSSSRRTKRA